jgi:hypothetical protein
MPLNEGKINTPEWHPKVIEKQSDFWNLLYDAKNQFTQIQFAVYSKTRTEEDIVTQNQEFKYLNFIDYIKTHNETISEKIINNEGVQNMIKVYDELLDRARKADSKEKMTQVVKDKEEFIKKHDLGFI